MRRRNLAWWIDGESYRGKQTFDFGESPVSRGTASKRLVQRQISGGERDVNRVFTRMHLVHHVRPSLLRTSRQVYGGIIPRNTGAIGCHRQYSIEPAAAVAELAESAPHTDRFIITETDSVSGPSKISAATRKTRLYGRASERGPGEARGELSKKLRKRNEAKRKAEAEQETQAVISAVKTATERDHAGQDDVLQTLHQAIASEPKAKSSKKKKKKSKVDTSALFDGFHENKPSEVAKGGWKTDEWLKSDWGPDSMFHFHNVRAYINVYTIPDLSPSNKKDTRSSKSRSKPPHQRPPLTYVRRIEGLLHPDDKPTLTGSSSYSHFRR